MTTLGEAILYLSADDSKLGQKLNSAKQSTSSWVSSVGAGISIAMGGVVVDAVGKAAGALVSMGTAGFNASMEIDQAQRELIGTLGVTEAEAERLGDLGVQVFKDNFAGSISEATAAIGEARKQLGDLSDDELVAATENAYRLSDAFEVDVNEGINKASTLMNEFGLSQQEAFDFMASGFQNGLDASGDFLDSIGEYSNLFADAGFSADEFYSIMESGAAGGVLGVDKVADAVKEMGIKLNEGNKDTKSAFETIGLSYDDIASKVNSGEATWADYFDQIVGGLNGIKNPTDKAIAQTAIFGTMAEDLGVSFTEGLSAGQTALEDMTGSIDKIDARYNNFGSMWEGVSRRLTIAIVPITDKLLDMANNAMPYVNQAVDWLEQQITELLPVLEEWAAWFFDVAIPAIIEFVTPILNQLIPGLQLLGEIVLNLATAIWPYILQAFQFLTEHMNIILPILAVVGAAILAISSPITFIAGLIVLLATAWANNWGGIQEKTQAVIDFIQPYIETAMNKIQEIVETVLAYLSAWWDEHGENLMLIVNTVWSWIESYIDTQIKNVQAIITTVAGLIQAFWEEWGDILLKAAERVWDNIETTVQAAMDILGYAIDAGAALIRGDWDAFGEALQNIWQTAWDAVETILNNAKATLVETVSKLKDDFVAVWDDIKEKFKSIGGDIVSGIKEGIEKAWEGLVSWFNEKLGDLLSTVDDVFDFGSPSKELIKRGRWIPESLAIGMSETAHLPVGAMAQMAGQTITTVNNFTQNNYSPSTSARRDFDLMSLELGFR